MERINLLLFEKAVFAILLVGLNFSSIGLCQEKLIIPFEITRNRTQLPVRIGNSDILKIILDSGMAFDGVLIYNPDVRESIKFHNAVEHSVAGAGRGNPSTALVLDSASFFVGDVKLENQRIIVLNNDLYKGFPSDGVIGYSILGHYVTEIDYDKKLMTLHGPDTFEPDSSWQVIPIYFKDNMIPWIDVEVVIKNENPIKLSMYIDYASGDAVELLEKPEQKFSTPDKTEEAYLGRGLSGDIYGKTGLISKLIIGSYELNNAKAAFAPAKVRSKQDNADGIIGNKALLRFNLVFDYINKRIYIKPNKGFHDLLD